MTFVSCPKIAFEGIHELGYLALGSSPGWTLGSAGIGVHWLRSWLIESTSSGGHAGEWSTVASLGGRPLQTESLCGGFGRITVDRWATDD